MLWFVCFFNYADRQAIFAVFPKLKEEFGFDTVQLGLIGSAFMWVYAARRAGRRVHRRPVPAQGPDPRRLPVLELRDGHDRLVLEALALRHRAGARGVRRDVLLPGLDVAGQRLPRPAHPLAGAVVPPVERLPRHDSRQLDWRVVRRARRLAIRLLLLRRPGHGAGRRCSTASCASPQRGAADAADGALAAQGAAAEALSLRRDAAGHLPVARRRRC